jgi:hypothetical protein
VGLVKGGWGWRRRFNGPGGGAPRAGRLRAGEIAAKGAWGRRPRTYAAPGPVRPRLRGARAQAAGRHTCPAPPSLAPRPSYDVDASRAEQFYGLVRAYWPGLPDGALAPAYSGVRPKVSAVSAHPGAPAGDFVVQGGESHGVAGLVAMYGMESPGLTSCLAIGRHVLGLLRAG